MLGSNCLIKICVQILQFDKYLYKYKLVHYERADLCFIINAVKLLSDYLFAHAWVENCLIKICVQMFALGSEIV